MPKLNEFLLYEIYYIFFSFQVINSVCDGEIKLAKESEEDYEDCDTNGDGGDRESECLQPVLPQLLTSITQGIP